MIFVEPESVMFYPLQNYHLNQTNHKFPMKTLKIPMYILLQYVVILVSLFIFSEEERDLRAWKKSIMLVFNRLASHKNASVFAKPITENDAPGYRDIVLRYFLVIKIVHISYTNKKKNEVGSTY